MPVRVYYEDTDAGGIVYHANYLKFAERGRTEFLRRAGYEHRALMGDLGAGFAVRRCAIEFLKPALLDDMLEVETRVAAVGGASVDMLQTIRRDGTTVATIDIQVVLIDRAGRPKRLPREMAAAVGRHGTTARS
nr:tol-pal system-associated acyl-CoA thioesterase [Marivibrio halodurans]